MCKIVPADTPQMLEAVKALLVEYRDCLRANQQIYRHEFQAFQNQLADLPGCFAPPDGCLLVGMHGKQAVGCVALRKLSDGICEMKRLYVKPAFRRMGIGRDLAEAVIAEARKIGIPIVAVVDSNSNPDEIDYPIPANDDAIRAIRLVCGKIATSILEGKAGAAMALTEEGEGEDMEEAELLSTDEPLVFTPDDE